MKLLTLSLLAVVALTAPAFAACQNYPIVTPDDAPVNRVAFGGSDSNGAIDARGARHGTCNPKAADFDAAAKRNRPGGFCDYAANLKSQSDKVSTHAYVTLDGVVADILRHRDGIAIPAIPALNIPATFIPTTGYLPGAC